jgi:hypothetical protein
MILEGTTEKVITSFNITEVNLQKKTFFNQQ